MSEPSETNALLGADAAANPVYALATAPGPAGQPVCYAASRAGLLAASDGGATWRPLFTALNLPEPLPATAVAVSPDHAADGSVFVGTNGGILRSFDRGASWYVAQLPTPPPLIVALATSPDFGNDGVVFAAAAQDGVFHSADRGSRWAAWNFGLLDLNLFCLAVSPAFARDETLFVGAEGGVYRSTNGAHAWRELGFPADAAPVLSLALSPHFESDGTLWAGSEAGGLFVSGDCGESWRRLLDGEIGAINALAAAANPDGGTTLLLLADAGLLRSENGGATWQDLSGLLEGDASAMCLAAPGALDAGAPIFVGRVDGTVRRIVLPASARTNPPWPMVAK